MKINQQNESGEIKGANGHCMQRKEKDEGAKPSGFSISRDSVADLITTPTLSALIGGMGIKHWPPIVRIV